MEPILSLLCCPVCRGELAADLRCAGCGEQFSVEKDVYRLVSAKVSKLDGCWNDSDWPEDYAPTDDRDENGKTYSDYLNDETKKARAAWSEAFRLRLGLLRGNVMDVATGMGGALRDLLESNAACRPIATDLCGGVLAYTKILMRKKYGITRGFDAVATDARRLAFKDGVMDAAVTLAGLQEINGSAQAAAEIRRVMKPGGRLTAMVALFDQGSPSALRAESFNGLRGVIKELLVEDVLAAGFREARIDIISKGVLAPNPRDRTPVAGDTMYYGLLEAVV